MGMHGFSSCYHNTDDAGMSCDDSSECDDVCVVENQDDTSGECGNFQ